MRNTRIHVELPLVEGAELLLPAEPSAHLLRVLRLRPPAALTLFNGQGGEYSAELLAAERNLARVRIGAHSPLDRESPLAVTLLQGIARSERMDLILQKATELGVTAIVPLACEFSVVRLEPAQLEKRRERWQAVAISACEQCGRNRVPRVQPITAFDDACLQPAPSPEPLRLMLVPDAATTLAGACAQLVPGQGIHLLVGPEGGLSGREQLLAQRGGFLATRIGPRVLRTETAPLAALAVLQAVAGDLGS
jgi:16S rRNA (uracil1498-N3)-methyltransferase